MSATENNGMDFNQPFLKSKQEIKKHKDELFAKSFGDLDDGEIYRDPLGFKTPGAVGQNAVELQKARYEQLRDEPVFDDGSSVLEKWDELQRKGFNVKQTTEEIQKNLDTGDWALPLDILPEV